MSSQVHLLLNFILKIQDGGRPMRFPNFVEIGNTVSQILQFFAFPRKM